MRYSVGLKTPPERWSLKQIASAHVKKRYARAMTLAQTEAATGAGASRVAPTVATKEGAQGKAKGMASRC